MKVVIDTNIWISFLIGKLLSNLDKLIFDKKVEIITCNQQISELFDVISKPKLIKYFSTQDIKRLFHFISSTSKFVNLNNELKICRDPKDDFLLEMSVIGNADFLITGDKDLLILEKYKKTKILTYKEFDEILSNS
jgi:putative PIN family toxin of toxin-antitoxin system